MSRSQQERGVHRQHQEPTDRKALARSSDAQYPRAALRRFVLGLRQIPRRSLQLLSRSVHESNFPRWNRNHRLLEVRKRIVAISPSTLFVGGVFLWYYLGTMKQQKKNELVIYQTKNGAVKLRGDFSKETIWATQVQIAEIFQLERSVATKHIRNIFRDKELKSVSVCAKFAHTADDGKVYQVQFYNLDIILAVGYRASSKNAIRFRQWATQILHQHITRGFTINPEIVKNNYAEFQKAIDNLKSLLPAGSNIDHASVLELVSAFADTWMSLDAYDKGELSEKGTTKKSVVLTAEQLELALGEFKFSLKETEIFGLPRYKDAVAGIVGSVMQTFGGRSLYSTVEEKAAHLLYFFVKNHPFVDGNKRNGAFAFVWFLRKTGIFDKTKITPPALTAITLFVAESNPRDKDQVVRLVLRLLKK